MNRCYAISWGSDFREGDGPMYMGYEFGPENVILCESKDDIELVSKKGKNTTDIVLWRRPRGDIPLFRCHVPNHQIEREPSLLWLGPRPSREQVIDFFIRIRETMFGDTA